MKLIILAAGYATRLSPLTDNCAKPLLKLANKYMIDHVLEKIACKEISEIHVITNKRFYKDFAIWAENKQNHFQGRQIFVWNDQTDTNENRLGAIGEELFIPILIGPGYIAQLLFVLIQRPATLLVILPLLKMH